MVPGHFEDLPRNAAVDGYRESTTEEDKWTCRCKEAEGIGMFKLYSHDLLDRVPRFTCTAGEIVLGSIGKVIGLDRRWHKNASCRRFIAKPL